MILLSNRAVHLEPYDFENHEMDGGEEMETSLDVGWNTDRVLKCFNPDKR